MVKVELEHISHLYSENAIVLNDVSLILESGKTISVLGPSGCGKTTLLKIIAGLINPTKGEINFSGKRVTNLPAKRRNVGYVPQNLALFPTMSAKDNITFGLRARHWSKEKINSRVEELAQIAEIESLLTRKPHELSGGQQQRVALLRALAPNPAVVLLDEPLAAIDDALAERLKWDLRRILKESGATAFHVTHKQQEAMAVGDLVAVLDHGNLLECAPPFEIQEIPKSWKVAKAVGIQNIFPIQSLQKGESGETKLNTSFCSFEIQIDKTPGDTERLGVEIDRFLPEIVVNTQHSESTGLTLKGKFVGIEPTGEKRFRMIFDLGNHQLLAIERDELPFNSNIGDEITIIVPQEALKVIGL